MIDPCWIKRARSLIGKKEVPGAKSDMWVLGLWDTIPWIWSTVARKDDSIVPWCGAFCRYVMAECSLPFPKKWWSAASWLDYGTRLPNPVFGCIGVLKRPKGAHVTFIIGKDNAGNLLGLGGNQGDAVKVSAFKRERFTGFVWPEGATIRWDGLPILSAEVSESES